MESCQMPCGAFLYLMKTQKNAEPTLAAARQACVLWPELFFTLVFPFNLTSVRARWMDPWFLFCFPGVFFSLFRTKMA